ncbi:MAG: hypothetical protein ABIL09_00190 [Gemmatimonadota bacterium]
MLRIFRSPRADFERDAELADEVYDDRALAALADSGFNAVWVRVIYRRLLPNPRYPAFGQDAEKGLPALNRVVERGARHGIGLVVYCQEPFGLAQDDPFWEEHPEMAGVPSDYDFGTAGKPFRMRALCASAAATRTFLEVSSEQLLRRVPGIRGVITITASEFMSHCFSHYATASKADPKRPSLDCPRCRERTGSEVAAEVLNCMRRGLDAADPEVPLIAWNWSWYIHEPDPQPGILARLAPGIHLQADFERGDTKVDPTGRSIEINEYSLSYAGPSARFRRTREAALERGRRVYAKLQLSTTHELATVSNIPLVGRLCDKAAAFRDLDLAGYMGCWNFGNELTLNTRAFNYFLSPDCPRDREAALRQVARDAFPGCDAGKVTAAWEHFGGAFDYYPFSIPFLYHSPLNYALALLVEPGPVRAQRLGRSWLMDPRCGDDDPAPSFGPFTPEEIAERLGTMARLWAEGLPEYRQIAREELAVLDDALEVYEADPRQGFHGEAHDYMVTPALIRRKQEALRGRV